MSTPFLARCGTRMPFPRNNQEVKRDRWLVPTSSSMLLLHLVTFR